jgi:hypothetical protein
MVVSLGEKEKPDSDLGASHDRKKTVWELDCAKTENLHDYLYNQPAQPVKYIV